MFVIGKIWSAFFPCNSFCDLPFYLITDILFNEINFEYFFQRLTHCKRSKAEVSPNCSFSKYIACSEKSMEGVVAVLKKDAETSEAAVCRCSTKLVLLIIS